MNQSSTRWLVQDTAADHKITGVAVPPLVEQSRAIPPCNCRENNMVGTPHQFPRQCRRRNKIPDCGRAKPGTSVPLVAGDPDTMTTHPWSPGVASHTPPRFTTSVASDWFLFTQKAFCSLTEATKKNRTGHKNQPFRECGKSPWGTGRTIFVRVAIHAGGHGATAAISSLLAHAKSHKASPSNIHRHESAGHRRCKNRPDHQSPRWCSQIFS